MDQAKEQDSHTDYHAILDLVDANLTPTDATGDWDTALLFLEEDHQGERASQETVDTVLDAISEQA